jgi:ketosteroid isomerase-like protein
MSERSGAASVVEAFGAACNAHDLDGALAWCSDVFVFESTTPPDGERAVGHEEARRIWEPIFANLATRVEVEETIVAEDRVVQRCVYEWGDGHVRAVDLYRVVGGKIVEKLSYVKG